MRLSHYGLKVVVVFAPQHNHHPLKQLNPFSFSDLLTLASFQLETGPVQDWFSVT